MTPEKDAIIELAHVAQALFDDYKKKSNLPKIFIEALQNKIDYYRRMADE